jgi:hypothetical protein
MSAIRHIITTKTRFTFTFIFASNPSEFFRAIVKGCQDPVIDQVEQRFIVKYFFVNGWGNKRIRAGLQRILYSSPVSNGTVKRQIKKFSTGDLSPDDDPRSRPPIEILGQPLQKFLRRCPFSSRKGISTQFRISPPTVKEILGRELGLKKFSRRLVLHLLSDDPKKSPIAASPESLSLLRACAEHDFEKIATGDGSRFQSAPYPDPVFTESRERGVPRIRQDIRKHRTSSTPTVFSRYKSVRLAVVWRAEAPDEGSRVREPTRDFAGDCQKLG